MAEDDDDLSEGATPSSGPSGVTPSQPPVPDFNRRLDPPPESILHTTKPPRLTNPRVTPASRTDPPKADPSAANDALQTPVTAETTTVPVTPAPDPDAEVCSGRPFDSFTQLKNGSTYAFRGESYLLWHSAGCQMVRFSCDGLGSQGSTSLSWTRMQCFLVIRSS